jgi:hypothetical protein
LFYDAKVRIINEISKLFWLIDVNGSIFFTPSFTPPVSPPDGCGYLISLRLFPGGLLG